MRTSRLLVASLLLVPLLASAATFPDVPSTSPYADAIATLVQNGVIRGNPDGTFHPKNPVNRAAMLKMLYLAAGRTASPANGRCFGKEFTADAWFASYVCDAFEHGFISGYGDGTFRPNSAVTFAEGIKMAFTVFEFGVNDVIQDDIAAAGLPHANPKAWYGKYLVAAVKQGILPLTGIDNAQFYPDDPMERQQAAALVYAAWQASLSVGATVSSSSSEASAASEASMTQTSSSSSAASASAHSSSSSAKANPPKPDIHAVNFPFKESWQFSGPNSLSYKFRLASSTVASIQASLVNAVHAQLTCRLFHVQSDGFSPEYYLGYQENQSCFLLNALTAGDYQLDLRATVQNAAFMVSAAVGKGDGNDGISQASPIALGQVRTADLGPNDLEDWYVFTVKDPTGNGVPLTVQTVSASQVTCLIYPWTDVDIYGFAGPLCSQEYAFPGGTYYLRIGHGLVRGSRQTYTLQVK
ncbi:S-layer homology domain-containing protein [Candidatus Peregrinibacteria bacterium]|nr:S-layer homology domain-containing protein [Candidatus Peregrinibacteria bacterium]MBI3815988.1 S-layer homology domain-containing protein [Candidatus Peregrinibacteria bacterium]